MTSYLSLFRLDLSPVLVVEGNYGTDVAHELTVNQRGLIGKHGGIRQQPGIDVGLRKTVWRVEPAVIYEERRHLGPVEVVDELFRQFLVRSVAGNASAVHRNRAALFGDNVADVGLVPHDEGQVAVVRLRDPSVPACQVLLEV